MKAPIRFAIVGCGAVAQRHVAQMVRWGKLVAVCDIDLEKARILVPNEEAEIFQSLDELLSDPSVIDVVAICTPNGLHAQHTIQCLKAGLHVLCEKPMALRTSDCKEMIDAAKTAGKLLFIVKQNRFNPPVLAVKKLLDEGELGVIYSVQVNGYWNRTDAYYDHTWKATQALSGGTLFAQFSHFIDLLYWLIGDVAEVLSFVANRAHPDIEFEDICVANLRFVNGAIGAVHFTTNSFKQNLEGSMTIFAEKGTVQIGGQYLNELSYLKLASDNVPTLEIGNPANQYGFYQGSMSNHEKVYQNLVNVLNGDATIATNGSEGLKTVEIIEKIYCAGRHV